VILQFLAIVATITAIAVIMLVFFRDNANRPEQAFVPDPENDKRVVVRGWTDDELRNILEDFAKMNELPESFVTQEQSGDSLLLSFPNDCHPELFVFLVNYLNYPVRYDLKGRDIAVAGRAALTRVFDLPDSSLVDQKATIYVPEQDCDYDCVYLRVESGQNYEMSFAVQSWKQFWDTRMSLKQVQDSRMSRQVREL